MTFPNYVWTTTQKKMWSQIFFVCPLGGSQKEIRTPEKKYGKKIASDPNFFLDKMIHCELFEKNIGSKKVKTPEI